MNHHSSEAGCGTATAIVAVALLAILGLTVCGGGVFFYLRTQQSLVQQQRAQAMLAMEARRAEMQARASAEQAAAAEREARLQRDLLLAATSELRSERSTGTEPGGAWQTGQVVEVRQSGHARSARIVEVLPDGRLMLQWVETQATDGPAEPNPPAAPDPPASDSDSGLGTSSDSAAP